MADDDILSKYYSGQPAQERYHDPNARLYPNQMPTLPLASFEADSAGEPAEPTLPARVLRALAAHIPQNTELPAPQFPMDPRSLSLAAMLSEGARHSSNWMDWPNKPHPEHYSPGDILAPTGGGAGVGAVAARSAVPTTARVGGNWPEAIGKHIKQERKEGNPFLGPIGLPVNAAMQAGTLGFALHDLAHGNYASGIPELIGPVLTGSMLQPHIRSALRIKNHLDRVNPEPHPVSSPSDMTLFANNRNASLPGILVNGLEQAAPRSRLELSPNLYSDAERQGRYSDAFKYHVIQDGSKIGSATGFVNGDTAHLSWLGATGLENSLGVDGLRQLREAFRRDYPNVTTFRGDRVSGVRVGTPNINSEAVVKLPANTSGLPLPSAPQQQDDDPRASLLRHYYGIPTKP